jgi:hypothetical protein
MYRMQSGNVSENKVEDGKGGNEPEMRVYRSRISADVFCLVTTTSTPWYNASTNNVCI